MVTDSDEGTPSTGAFPTEPPGQMEFMTKPLNQATRLRPCTTPSSSGPIPSYAMKLPGGLVKSLGVEDTSGSGSNRPGGHGPGRYPRAWGFRV